MITSQRVAGESKLKHGNASLGLVAGLRAVSTAVSSHIGDGVRVNIKALVADRSFCAFVIAGCSCFGVMAARDFIRLSAKRRAAKRERMLHLATTARGSATERQAGGGSSAAAALAKKKKKKKRAASSKEFRRQLVFLLRIVIPNPFCRGARLFAAQFCLLVMRTLVTLRCSKLCVYFLTRAIAQGSWKYWVRWLVNFCGWTAGGVLVNTGLKYTEALIELELRQRLTEKAHSIYMRDNRFYAASSLRRTDGLDSPDQRITTDIAEFSRKLSHLYGHSFSPVLNFVLSLFEASKDLGMKRPLALITWNIVTSTLLRASGPSLGPMVAREQELEGSFRSSHSRLIAHSEEVAFLQGADTERGILDKRLKELTDERGWFTLQRIRRDLADQFFKFQSLAAGGVFIHIPFMTSTDLSESERISAFRSTEELMLRCGGAFSELVQIGRKVEELQGYTGRIVELFDALSSKKAAPSARSLGTWVGEEGGNTIRFDRVSVSAPGDQVDSAEGGVADRLLVKDLNLTVGRGQSVLVTGPNGCGKTSLFRVLAGLWPSAEGKVTCPTEGLMWLPQRPYLVMGTLRDQVAYPRMLGYAGHDDARIKECLAMAGLGRMAAADGGLDMIEEEWEDVLSGGERQRIGFARLYYHRPAFAVLDECTSAINPEEECGLYDNISQMGTTVFSIAHRHELRRFHQWELQISGDGTGTWLRKPLPGAR